MFFFLAQILSFLLTPIIWILFLLIFSIFTKNQKLRKGLIILTSFLIIVLTNSYITDKAIRAWETPAIKDKDLDSVYDIGIVLGGGMVTYDSKYDRLVFKGSTDRILQAIRLYKIGKIKKIMIVGGAGSLVFPDLKEAIYLKKYLLIIGIPQNDIIIETESDNTHQNVVNTKKILDSMNFKGKILLITSGYHMKRSIACFENAEIKVLTGMLAQQEAIFLIFLFLQCTIWKYGTKLSMNQ